jgi:hypothetical protein
MSRHPPFKQVRRTLDIAILYNELTGLIDSPGRSYAAGLGRFEYHDSHQGALASDHTFRGLALFAFV